MRQSPHRHVNFRKDLKIPDVFQNSRIGGNVWDFRVEEITIG
jgi:hypothetical protein